MSNTFDFLEQTKKGFDINLKSNMLSKHIVRGNSYIPSKAQPGGVSQLLLHFQGFFGRSSVVLFSFSRSYANKDDQRR